MKARIVAVLLGAVLGAAGSAVAAPPTAPSVRLGHNFSLVEGGQAVSGQVRVSCPAGTEVLEALVTVSQEEGRAFGQGGIPGFPCDGHTYKRQVVIRSDDMPFRPGTAFASAFVLVIDAQGSTQQAQDSRTVRIR